MSVLMTINLALAAVNALLALGLAIVYLRNHRQIRSPFTLALTLFAAFFVLHNGVLVYHFVTMMTVMGGPGLLLAEGLLQTAALSAMAWATLR